MKKKLNGETRHFVSVKLYKNDLDEIMEIMGTISTNIQISDHEFDYDSIEELEERRGQYINDLELTIDSPLFSVTCAGEAKLMRGRERETLAPYLQIQSILKSRIRPFFALIFNPFVGVVIFLSVLASLKYIAPIVLGRLLPTIAIVLLYVTILLTLVLFFGSHRLGGFSRVILLHKHQEQSFWKRNRDTIIVSIFVGIVVAVVTWAITYFTAK